MKKKNLFFALLVCLFMSAAVKGQNVALKTNLLYDATATFNLGVEFGVAPKWTIDLSGNYNPFTFSHSRKWKHWLVQPEARYWFCDRFAGHFIGFHALGGQYNFANLKNDVRLFGTDFSQLTDHRLQGWFAGGGVAYGYSWVLGRRWNLELEIGLGYVYTKYDKFKCEGCGKRVETGKTHHYFGPTKAAINMVYNF
ncbi:DUF3575 domain-containing protein [Bacteroides sp. KG156]|uniref:DUF3575 domain-containing protein n=1 Tax=unclassified Bacteroides TaxID=2646097 RepID=UPI003D979CD0